MPLLPDPRPSPLGAGVSHCERLASTDTGLDGVEDSSEYEKFDADSRRLEFKADQDGDTHWDYYQRSTYGPHGLTGIDIDLDGDDRFDEIYMFQRDRYSRPTRRDVVDAESEVLLRRRSYEYDDPSGTVSYFDDVNGDGSSDRWRMMYFREGRLVRIEHGAVADDGELVGEGVTLYAWDEDALSLRTSVRGGVVTGVVTYTYDTDSNLLLEDHDALGDGTVEIQYSYDYQGGDLSSVSLWQHGAAHSSGTYRYNELGQVIQFELVDHVSGIDSIISYEYMCR